MVYVPMLYAEISSVWAEIDEEMAEWKATSDQIWREMQAIGGGGRWRRQNYGPYAPPPPYGAVSKKNFFI